MNSRALLKAIKIAGSQSALARMIGTTQSAVRYWYTQSRHGVPAEFAAKIEKATGVKRSELRPDLWPVKK